jgi:hypothetical protein
MADDRKRDRERRDEREPDDETTGARGESDADSSTPNPPRTTAGGWTSPKFGSAGSGGAELEPGPERD